jgi:hypothetical protein
METLIVGRMLGVHDGHDAEKLEYRSGDHRLRQAGAEMGRLKARSMRNVSLGFSASGFRSLMGIASGVDCFEIPPLAG